MPDIAAAVAMPWSASASISREVAAPWTGTVLLTSIGGPFIQPGGLDLTSAEQRADYLFADWEPERDAAEAQAILSGDFQELTGTVVTWHIRLDAPTNGDGLSHSAPRNTLTGVNLPAAAKFRLLFAKGVQQLQSSMLFVTGANLSVTLNPATTELLIGSYDPANGSRCLAEGDTADLRCAATLTNSSPAYIGRPIIRVNMQGRTDAKVIVSGIAGHNPNAGQPCYDMVHIVGAGAGSQVIKEFIYPGSFPESPLQGTGYKSAKAYSVEGQANLLYRFLRQGSIDGDGIWVSRPGSGGTAAIRWCDLRQPEGTDDISGPDPIQFERAGTNVGAIEVFRTIGHVRHNTKANFIISGGTKPATGESLDIDGCIFLCPDAASVAFSPPDNQHATAINVVANNARIRGSYVSGSGTPIKVEGDNAVVVGNVIVRHALAAITSGGNWFAGIFVNGANPTVDLNTLLAHGEQAGGTAIQIVGAASGVARNNVVVGKWGTVITKPAGVTETGTFQQMVDSPDVRFDRIGRPRSTAVAELVATLPDAGTPAVNFLGAASDVSPRVRGALQVLAPPPGTETTPSDPGSLVARSQIPDASLYRLAHTVSLVEEESSTALRVLSASLSTDAGSVCWTLQAEIAGVDFGFFAGLQLPVVALTIDGIVFRFVVEAVRRSRAFVAESLSITGRSIAMVAGAPYQVERNWINEGSTLASQLVIFAQLDSETDVGWELEDWLVPDKVWSYTGTPLAVAQRVAEAVAGIVRCDRAENRIYITPRYPIPPNEWHTTAPDVDIHLSGVESEGYERADQPAYNAVYVSGQQQGSLAYVRIAGTNGDNLAPLVTDQLLTELPANRQRGEAILGAGGRQVRQQLTLPVIVGTARPGILELNALCRVIDPARTWWGLVRAVSVQLALDADVPVVRQVVTLERKLEMIEGTTTEAPPPNGQEVGGVILSPPAPAPNPGLPPSGQPLPPGPPLIDGQTRNVYKWPWASDSAWNTPVGRGARLIKVPVKMSPPGYTGRDYTSIDEDPTEIQLDARAPMTDVVALRGYVRGDNDARCADGSNSTGRVVDRVPWPANHTVPSNLENASGAIILQDGRTVRQQQPITRCRRGGAVAYLPQTSMRDQDILLDDGHNGSHGGGLIGGLGGCLFIGDLGPDRERGPERVLGITWNMALNAAKPINYGGEKGGRRRYPDFPGGSFRGIATTSDGGTYSTTRGYGIAADPSMPRGCVMGARLVLHHNETPESLGIETQPGRLLFWTAQRFGFIIGDESGYSARRPDQPAGEDPFGLGAVLLWTEHSDPAGFTTPSGVFIPGGNYKNWFQSVWAPTLGPACWGGTSKARILTNTPWTRDLQRIYLGLWLVEDDLPGSWGGAGERLWTTAPEPALP